MAEAQKKVEEVVEDDGGQEIELDAGEEQVETAPEEAVAEEAQPEEKSKDELEEYSKGVQTRINELTSRMREEERQKNEAITFAESVKKQNDELRAKVEKLDESFVGEFGSRVESAMEAAKKEFEKAHEDGDAEALMAATQKISRLSLDQARHEEAVKSAKERQAAPEEAPVAAPQQVAPKPVDPRARRWAEENTWFGEDEAMTYAAYGIHNTLTKKMGLDPKTEDYYTALDNAIREAFPHKFEEAKPVAAAPSVASAGASASKAGAKKGRRTVKLNQSQLAIAKRLGVTPEQYAAHVKD